MRDAQLKLKDKTVIYCGFLNSLSQSLTMTLTELGANVAFVNVGPEKVDKFIDNVNIAREANPHIGKAIPLNEPFKTASDVQLAIDRVAESFGTIDIMVDGFFTDTKLLSTFTSETKAEEELNQHFQFSNLLSEFGLPYLTGRKRGRYIIYNYKIPEINEMDKFLNTTSHELVQKVMYKSAETIYPTQVTVNSISVGLTEEFLLKRYPKTASIKVALEEIKKVHKNCKIIEPYDVAQACALIASPMSCGINFQNLNLNYGFDIFDKI